MTVLRRGELSHSQQLADLLGPVTKLLERNLTAAAEASVAALVLSMVERIAAGRLEPEVADEVCRFIVVCLADHPELPSLGEDVQELLIEAQHLHHTGDPQAPSLAALRDLASRVLDRLR